MIWLILPSGTALAGYDADWAVARRTTTANTWDGARANLEIRNGRISDSDAEDGYKVAQVLWVYCPTGTSDWVEAGFTRGWTNENMLALYWGAGWLDPSTGHQQWGFWRITNAYTVGERTLFGIMHFGGSSGDYTWRVYVDGSPASSVGGNLSYHHGTSYTRKLECGIQRDASTGMLGSSSDWCNNRTLSYTTNDGASWPWWGTAATFVKTPQSGNPIHIR